MIQVLFFGPLSDITGIAVLELSEITDTDMLTALLHNKYPSLEKSVYTISVNHILITQTQNLRDGDEIALLAPFAGG